MEEKITVQPPCDRPLSEAQKSAQGVLPECIYLTPDIREKKGIYTCLQCLAHERAKQIE